jgi:hypothetical protein
MRFGRWLALAGFCWAGAVAAGEPVPRLPEGAAVRVIVEAPAAFADDPLVRDVTTALWKSSSLRAVVGSPDFDPVFDIQAQLEKEWGVETLPLLRSIAAGGLEVAVYPGFSPVVAVRIDGGDAAGTERYVQGLIAVIQERAARAGGGPVAEPAEPVDGVAVRRLGGLHLAQRGAVLLAATDRAMIETLIRDAAGGPRVPAAAPAPRVWARLQWKLLRELPGVNQALRLPVSDGGPIALFGGWIDLLRRSDVVEVELGRDTNAAGPEQAGLALSVRFSAPPAGVTPGLEGFWGADAGGAPALARPPGVIYSAAWHRDYDRMWKSRRQFLDSAAADAVDAQQARLARENAGLGISEVLQHLGPHFRLVVVEQPQPPYDVELSDRVPAAAGAVSLKNVDGFADQVLRRMEGFASIIALVAKMSIRRPAADDQYVDADGTTYKLPISCLRFSTSPQEVGSGNRIRFNFEPAWCIAHGHFAVGSTRHAVAALLREIERGGTPAAPGGGPGGPIVVERQEWDLARLGQALRGLRESIVRQAALDNGYPVDEADRELDVAVDVLERIRRVTVEAAWGDSGFEYRVRVGR